MKKYKLLLLALVISLIFSPLPKRVHAQTDAPVVRAVLFYSPTCPHCQQVIKETLLPLIDKYGDQLQILAIDVTKPLGQQLFLVALDKFKIESAGVPFLVIEDTHMIGSVEIPEKFPGLIESYLAQGGSVWPDIPGLESLLNGDSNTPVPTATPLPIVHAVLFYRGTCSHCQKIIEEVIPPLQKEYGKQLHIFNIDVSTAQGNALYDAAIERFSIERIGVPTLIIDTHVLVGGEEIQQSLAGLIEGYLGQGGITWPDISGLEETISQAAEATASTAITPAQAGTLQTPPVSATVSSASALPTRAPGIIPLETGTSTWLDRFARDRSGNLMAVLVLMGMLASVVWAITTFKKDAGDSIRGGWAFMIPILCVLGLGVAGYLAYVETTQATAVCGPIGDCNTVQQSEYARLFGILPIGVLGMIGYIGIIIAWFVARNARNDLADLATLSLFAMTAFGTLFSIYLTFLEPFVIGATCAWCLTSSVLMTALMLLSARLLKVSAFEQVMVAFSSLKILPNRI